MSEEGVDPLSMCATRPGVPFDPDQSPMDRCIIPKCEARSTTQPLLGITYRGQIAAICFSHARNYGLIPRSP